LLALDASFTTNRIFRLDQTAGGFRLDDVATEPPIRKSYSLGDDVEAIPNHDWIRIAEHDHKFAGVASVTLEAWNRRAVLQHLYVSREARRNGVGRALVEAALDAAQDLNARCLWVETQTINYAAVQFYQSLGFAWCGFDTSLYAPHDVGVNEVALFFVRKLA
jgi:ribosomal protein S18 acetylase RimI-like enzyme